MITIKRAYDPPADSDGFRVLIDRLWPRGIKKQDAAVDSWLKEIAPTTELRKWFNHDPEKFDTFRTKYELELDENTKSVQQIADQLNQGPITLVYAARETEFNHAVVLRDYLLKPS